MRARLEVCIDSADGAAAAEAGGAGAVELCAALVEGGITPSLGLVRATRAACDIELNVMVRPRGGDFVYDRRELEAMHHDVAAFREAGADGVVLGVLRPDGTVDEERVADLVAAARPLRVTFHRAFDMTRDPRAALETLIELGVDRVLSSGQEASAPAGVRLLTELVEQADHGLGPGPAVVGQKELAHDREQQVTARRRPAGGPGRAELRSEDVVENLVYGLVTSSDGGIV